MNKNEFLGNLDFYLKEIKSGKIFVYPTDTIYGIGCDANNCESIEKIRDLKKRDEKPFSIIASKDWILENCEVSKEIVEKYLPGPYTLILKLKKDMICKKELIGELDSIGVRIPKNWFCELLIENDILFVTTSVNIAGEKHISEISEIGGDIKSKIDHIIDGGILNGKPSTLVDLRNGENILSR